MATTVWSDKISVVAVQKVANGALARGVLNLTTDFGALLFLRIGRLTTTAPTTGITAKVRRFLYDQTNARDIPHPTALATFQDITTAANLTTLSGTPTFPGSTVALTATTGMGSNQTVVIVDSASAPTRAEWHQTSLLSSSNLTMDRPLANTGIKSGDTITNQGLVLPPVWIDGGGTGQSAFEVIFDYGAEASASPVVVEAWAQELVFIGNRWR